MTAPIFVIRRRRRVGQEAWEEFFHDLTCPDGHLWTHEPWAANWFPSATAAALQTFGLGNVEIVMLTPGTHPAAQAVI